MTSAYLDWNATTPLADEAYDPMALARQQGWANPASVHGAGRAARRFVEDARREIALLLETSPRDLIFTSGGTEANNLALHSGRSEGALVVSSIEHPSVLRVAEKMREGGAEVHFVPVGPDGVVGVDAFRAALSNVSGKVRLISLQSVNHETGVLQPIAEVAGLAHESGALFHTDAVQAIGKVPIQLDAADLISVAAHKIRGPKGIGALASKCGTPIAQVLLGGSQERGVRPGTQDAVLAAGFRVAAARAQQGPQRYQQVARLRDRIETFLVGLGGVVNGTGLRVPHVCNLSFAGWLGPELCAALDLEGVYVSSGSACSAGTLEPSPVIQQMVGTSRAASAIRISLGDETTEAEVAFAIEVFSAVLGRRAFGSGIT